MLPRGSRRSLWGWLALLVLLLLGAAMTAAEENAAGQEPPPGVHDCSVCARARACARVRSLTRSLCGCACLCLSAPVDWSKTAKSTGQAKLNRYSKWVQYVVGGEVFYVKGDDWSTRRDDPVRSAVATRFSRSRLAWFCNCRVPGVSHATVHFAACLYNISAMDATAA